jgi:hypothetical protein
MKTVKDFILENVTSINISNKKDVLEGDFGVLEKVKWLIENGHDSNTNISEMIEHISLSSPYYFILGLQTNSIKWFVLYKLLKNNRILSNESGYHSDTDFCFYSQIYDDLYERYIKTPTYKPSKYAYYKIVRYAKYGYGLQRDTNISPRSHVTKKSE